MKKLFVILLAAAGISFTAARAQILVGTGPDSSYLVIEAADFGAPLVYEFRYDYDPLNPLDGYALMSAIDAADPDITFSWVDYGTLEEPNYFLNSVTYLTVTLTNTPFPDFGPYWAQWVSGGEVGVWNPDGSVTPEPIASGIWAFGPGSSAPYRIVEPGSWDGFIYNLGDSAPSTAPVPEPAAALLVFSAVGVWIWQNRRRVGGRGFGRSALPWAACLEDSAARAAEKKSAHPEVRPPQH